MKEENFWGKLIRLALPFVVQSLLLALVAVADTVMLGRVEQNQMSAVALATQIQFIQNMMLGAVTATILGLGAQYYGKGDTKTIEKIFCMSLRLSGLVSLAFAMACVFMPAALMAIFTNDATMAAYGVGYLRIAGWSYLLTGISQCYISIMKVTDHAKECATVSFVAVGLNVVLNAFFIFGLFGLPAMGAKGAALATLIARIVELAIVVVLSYKKGYLHPGFRGMFERDALLAKDFRNYALPILGACILWGFGFTSYTAVMGHMGQDAAAANAIAEVVRDLLCCMCNGICNAGAILVGNELGSGNLEKGRLYGDRLIKGSFIIGFISAGIMLLVSPLILAYMKLTPTAHEYLKYMLIVMAVYMVARCVCTIVINGVFAAGGDTIFDMYSLVVAMWLIAVPLSFLGAFVFHWPVLVVFFCTCLDEIGKIPWVLLHARKHKWVKDLTR